MDTKTNDKKRALKAYAGMAVSTLIIGLSFVFVKISLSHCGVLDVLAHRFTVAAVVLLLLYAVGIVHRPHLSRKELGQLLGLSMFYPLLFFMLQAVGLKYTTASEAGIISALTPVLTLLMAMIFLKEQNTIGQILGVVVSLLGVCYIFVMNGASIHSESLRGNLIVLLSVFSTVLYYILGRRVLRNYKALDVTFVMILTGCLVFDVIAVTNHLIQGTLSDFFVPLGHSDFLLSILYLGVLSSLLTSVFNNYALGVISASQVAVVNNLTPIISVMGGIWVLGEKLSYFHYIGGILVILGVLATHFFGDKES